MLRRIFVPLDRFGRPKIEPRFFRRRIAKKKPYTRLGNAFWAHPYILNIKILLEKVPNHGEGSSVPLKCTVALCTTVTTLLHNSHDTVNSWEIYFCWFMYIWFFIAFCSLSIMSIFKSVFQKVCICFYYPIYFFGDYENSCISCTSINKNMFNFQC